MLRSCKLQPLQTLSAALAPASPGGDLLEEENLDVKKKKGAWEWSTAKIWGWCAPAGAEACTIVGKEELGTTAPWLSRLRWGDLAPKSSLI